MKIKRKIIISSMLFVLFCFNSSGLSWIVTEATQEMKLYGRVIAYETNETLYPANIFVKNKPIGTINRSSGYFDLSVPSENDSLVVTFVGYEPFITLIGDIADPRNMLIVLKEGIRHIEEVTIATEKERIIRVSEKLISTTKISPGLISKLPNLGEVDVMRGFQYLPGVMATNETSSGLFVRGGTPDQNLILYDGMSIYHVDHFYGFFSAFNANAIDDIQLIKGGFPAEYGGRTSSVLTITGKPADFKEYAGGVSVSLLSVNGFMEIPVIEDKLSFQIAARRSYTDIIRTRLYNNIFNLYQEESSPNMPAGGMRGFQMMELEPKFHFYDINSKLTYKLNQQNTFSLSLYNGKDNLDNSREDFSFMRFDNDDPGLTDITSWGNIGGSLNWESLWNERFNTSIFLSYSNYFSTRIRETGNTQLETSGRGIPGRNTYEDNKVEDISFRIKNQWRLNKNNLISFGLENTYNNIQYNLSLSDTLQVIDRKNEGNQTALYLQHEITLGNKLDINTGIRGTYFNITQKYYPEPRLSASYELFKGNRIKAAWGQYYQYTKRIIREDVLEGSNDFWLLAGDETVPVSFSEHYIVGANYEINNYFFDAEAFYKKYEGLTEYSMRFRGFRMIDDESQQHFFEGSGYAKGIELLAQKKFGKNTGWISYTLSEVMYAYPEMNNGNSYFALHDQTHEFKTVYSRSIKKWDLSGSFIYATGKPYTAPVSQYQLTMLNGDVYSYIHVSDKNTFRLPEYHRLDISATYNWSGENDKINHSLSFSIFNLYNRKNTRYKEFSIQEDQVGITDIRLLGITPNLSYTIKF